MHTKNLSPLLVLLALLCLGTARQSSYQQMELRTGQDYALFFAVNDYEQMDDLQKPVQNAREIAVELQANFGFKTEVVKNPTLDDIDAKLDEYERKFQNGTFDQNGQLLVYFSGHGIVVGDNGYFMTRSADPERPHRTALDYNFLRGKINNLACQHILTAIDACHSANFDPLFGTRSDRGIRPGEQNFDRIIAHHKQFQTRIFWTSDSVGKETPDRSNFAYKLLEGLRAYQNARSYIKSSELFTLYLEDASPRPGGGRFGKDEPSGCFLFFRPGEQMDISPEEESLWQQAKRQDSETGYAFYKESYPEGHFLVDAKSAIKRLQGRDEKPARSWIFDGIIAPSYEIGLNTQKGQKDWLSQEGDSFTLRYPGQQDWGVTFFSIGDAYPDEQKDRRKTYDFSGYSTLLVDMKSERNGTLVEIGMKDKYDLNNGAETKIATPLTTAWTTYTFPLSDFKTTNLEAVHIPVVIVFGREAATIDIRNIRLN